MSLLFFIADLDRDVNLQAAFLEDPTGTMTAQGLTAQQAALFTALNVPAIAAAVAQEVAQLASQFRGVRPFWPGPRLQLTSMTPNTKARGTNVSATIFGAFFPANLACQLASGREIVMGQGVQVSGTPFSSQAQVDFALRADLPPGTYNLQAEGFSDRPEAAVLAGAFTVT